MVTMADPRLILVHGLYTKGASPSFEAERGRAVAAHGEKLGVRSYECVLASQHALANRILRRIRGTARAVDAVEIFELEPAAFRLALSTEAGRAEWQRMASCAAYGLDPTVCFTLLGPPRKLLDGMDAGRRILWFGRGQPHLTDAQFAAHYSERHGPLVAGYAKLTGLSRYTQVVAQEAELCQTLRTLGLGSAQAPVVFAQLVIGTPAPSLDSLHAMRAIAADEKEHIDFSRSMLLLA